MSIICRTDKGWVISHYDYSKKIYTNVLSQTGEIDLAYNKNLFQILTPLMRDQEAKNFVKNLSEKEYAVSNEVKMMKRPRSANFHHEIDIINVALKDLVDKARFDGYFHLSPSNDDFVENNKPARSAAEGYDANAGSSEGNFTGGNTSSSPQIVELHCRRYLIPSNCSFHRYDIGHVNEELNGNKFDFILIDPPWWNKSIRRKKAKSPRNGYGMLPNSAIQDIQLATFLRESGLVGVWCTNAPSHIDAVKEQFFKSWGLKYVATWFWIKVTCGGELIRHFGGDTEKRPYERIMFGSKENRSIANPEPDMCFVSVPSAIHSHKPPIVEIIQSYLPDSPRCLELFARYLLPGWTSLGNQVLDLQSFNLYEPPEDAAI